MNIKKNPLKVFGQAIAVVAVSAIGGATLPTLASLAQTPEPDLAPEADLTPEPDPDFSVEVLPAVLAEIREAPFSELFTVADGEGYAVKDQDYLSSEPYMGFFSLWANVPDQDLLGVAVRYCFEDTDLAQANAELVQMTLSDGDTPLVTIDQVVKTEAAELNEIRPPRQTNVTTSFYYDPFYDPFYYSPFSFGVSYAPSTYIPGVECSEGSALFNLAPVQAELVNLPDKTLQVRLLFSNGATEYWQLGKGTVSEMKNLPSLAAIQ